MQPPTAVMTHVNTEALHPETINSIPEFDDDMLLYIVSEMEATGLPISSDAPTTSHVMVDLAQGHDSDTTCVAVQ